MGCRADPSWLVTVGWHPRGMGQSGARRRERVWPARACVVKVYLSVEERELLRAGAATLGVTVAGFAARAALDAAAVATTPDAAGVQRERLARLQFELARVRRRLDSLRAELATGQGVDVHLRCADAAAQLTALARTIHRRLGAER